MSVRSTRRVSGTTIAARTRLPANDGNSLLTLIHEQFADEKARDDHGVGWNRALDNLEALLA